MKSTDAWRPRQLRRPPRLPPSARTSGRMHMGPLAGIRVLDLSQIVSGPMAAAWLADQGADVIKLESPGGDPVRQFGARKGTMSAIFVAVNRGKRGETLDLKNPAHHARFEELLRWADVL